jgi:putative tryptophan/tyrosine transport system substrate-binding protein
MVEMALLETASGVMGDPIPDPTLVLPSNITTSHRTQFADLAVKSQLPAIYPMSESVEDGGLISYGTNVADLYKRVATYVDKILKGVKPADLPVEQPKKFEFIIPGSGEADRPDDSA